MEKYKQALRDFLAGVMPGRENSLVFGEGPLHPKLMLIGEAPGEQETLMGRPFVGKAGKNLDRFLELAGMRREEIYISNAVKIRPTKTGKTGRISNRPPTGGNRAVSPLAAAGDRPRCASGDRDAGQRAAVCGHGR